MTQFNLIHLDSIMAAPTKNDADKPAISVSIRIPQVDYDRLKEEQQTVAKLAGFEPSLNILINKLITEALEYRLAARSTKQ